MARRMYFGLLALFVCMACGAAMGQDLPAGASNPAAGSAASGHVQEPVDYWSMLFVFVLATFIGLGVIARVSRLLHTPLMSITNAISAIAVVGSIMIAGSEEYSIGIRILGAVALFASMTNIVSGFLITDRMLKMFKQSPAAPPATAQPPQRGKQ